MRSRRWFSTYNFQDTGLGLAEEYKHNPEEIFNSFESSKKID